MLLVQGRNLDIVTQSQTIEGFLPLHSDLWRTSCALYIVELIDRFTAEGEEDYPLFSLLVDGLRWLCQARNGELVLRYFELHFLECLGYQPELEQCVSCHSPLKPVTNFFAISGGGVLCPRCRDRESIVCLLSPDALKVLNFLQHSNYATANRLQLSPELSSELEQLMRRYIRHLLEREVKSAEWLDRLRKEP